jgi:four helix bundle protein
MERSNVENLRIYQLSTQLANEIWKIVLTWNTFAKDTVGKQMVRAVDSIGANIAEGSGRGSARDNLSVPANCPRIVIRNSALVISGKG